MSGASPATAVVEVAAAAMPSAAEAAEVMVVVVTTRPMEKARQYADAVGAAGPN